MEKLLELEKKLKEYKESLDKMNDEVNGSFEQSEKHPDEKEDKRLMAEALDEHNEKKHNEPKDKDSAYKDLHVKKEEGDVIKMEEVKFAKNGQWSLDKKRDDSTDKLHNREQLGVDEGPALSGSGHQKWRKPKSGESYQKLNSDDTEAATAYGSGPKSIPKPNKAFVGTTGTSARKSDENLDKGLGSKLDTAEHKAKVSQALGSIRQPAKVTTAEGTKIVSRKEQVADIKNVKSSKAADAKAKAESEAAERRASYKK